MSRKKSREREPFVRVAKRDGISSRRAWCCRGIAFLAALASGGLLVFALGNDPLCVYRDMVIGAWGSPTVIRETVKLAVPLLITSLALALAFRMRFWNIGGEGQIIAGALAAGFFGFFTADIFSAPALTALMFSAGMVAGGLYGLIPAVFKAIWGTNETLFTLMLNYVALAFLKFLMNGPWKAPGSSFPKMPMLVPEGRLEQVLGVHWGWILALVLVVIAWLYFNKTTQGYEVAVVGKSPDTAHYAGINVKGVIMRTMFISGALCGLAGMLQFAGADYTIAETITGGVGFTAIMVAWLARMNPFGIAAVSVFIAMLERGSNTIQTIYKIPASASSVLIGTILFFMLGCEFFIRYRIVLRGRGRGRGGRRAAKARQDGGGPPGGAGGDLSGRSTDGAEVGSVDELPSGVDAGLDDGVGATKRKKSSVAASNDSSSVAVKGLDESLIATANIVATSPMTATSAAAVPLGSVMSAVAVPPESVTSVPVFSAELPTDSGEDDRA